MKPFIDFWKKDVINKMIVILILVLLVGAGTIGYLLVTIKPDSIFYAMFVSDSQPEEIPTVSVSAGITKNNPATSRPSGTKTPIPTILVEMPTETAVVQTPVPSPTPSPIPQTPTEAVALTSTATPEAALNQDPSACIPDHTPQTGTVIDVIDGNTVKVLLDGVAYIVRYIGVDVPKYQPAAEYFGVEADFKNAEFVFAKTVTLVSDDNLDRDDAGRLLRYVKVGNVFVNYELVSNGYAWASKTNNSCAGVFANAEMEAKNTMIGIWMPTATPPSP